MDLWDLTKLLFRRWYFAVPVLLLTVVVSLYFQANVKPDYIATSYVAVIPPAPTPNNGNGTADGSAQKARNPWIDLGIDTLGTATIHTIEDKSVLESLTRAGFSTSFTITRDDYAPIYSIAVTGSSVAQATGSVRRLVALFDDTVTSLQQSYGAPSDRLFTTRRLDLGDNVTVSNTKRKRALIAIVGAGVLFAAGTTIAVDAILRRRMRGRPLRVREVGDPDMLRRSRPRWRLRDRAMEAPPAGELVALMPAPDSMTPQGMGFLNGPGNPDDELTILLPPPAKYNEKAAAAEVSDEEPGGATVVIELAGDGRPSEDVSKPTSEVGGSRR